MEINPALSSWIMSVCSIVLPSIIIHRKRIEDPSNECAYSESVESYICSDVLIMKDKDGGKFSTGVITVENVKFVNSTVSTLRISCPLESTIEGLLGGVLTIFLRNIRVIVRPNQKKPVYIAEVDHIKTRSIEDGSTKLIRICSVHQFVDMSTGRVCGPDGYPIPGKTKSDS